MNMSCLLDNDVMLHTSLLDDDIDNVDVEAASTNINNNKHNNKNEVDNNADTGETLVDVKAQWRDIIGFFIFALLADALPGYFFSATIISTFNNNPAAMMLSASVGGLIGALGAATLLFKRFSAEIRVVLCALTQLTGLLLSWLLPYPASVAGLAILTVGFVGMLATVLPLTSHKPHAVTRAYQFGFSGSPILGIALIELGSAIGMSINELYGVVICVPFILCIIFFLLIDRSTFKQKVAGTTKESNNSLTSSGGIKKDGEKTPVSLVGACREIVWAYWLVYSLAFALHYFYLESVQQYFYSSSSSYANLEPTKSTGNNIILATHIFVFLIGSLAGLIPRLSQVNRLILWVPMIVILALLTTILLGLHGYFPPIGIVGTYIIGVVYTGSFYYIQLFTPLIMRNDTKLTKRYIEVQIQTLVVINQMANVSISILSVFWARQAVLDMCRENYEDVYDGVSCTY